MTELQRKNKMLEAMKLLMDPYNENLGSKFLMEVIGEAVECLSVIEPELYEKAKQEVEEE